MVINFEFGSSYSDALGTDRGQIEIIRQSVTLAEALLIFLADNPGYKKVFELKNIVVDGKFQAAFVCGDRILREDSLLSENINVKILSPICGG
jgi:hypothetical protein